MHTELSASVQNGLAWFYVLVAALNVGFAYYFITRRDRVPAIVWLVVAAVFLVHAGANFTHQGWALSEPVANAIDAVTNPVSYFILSAVGFGALLVFRRYLTQPLVAWAIMDACLLAYGWAMTNPDFREIMTKADNVPIIILIVSVALATWLGLRRAVLNDDLIAKGEPPLEKDDDKVLVWPDLVYTELICMVVCTAVLVVWGVYLKAPLEQPATSAKAPNPSKAPWYFLGLQEMLVYFDPWMAGVVLPTLIIVGLIALPYIDFNQKGNGYYTFKERPFAMTTFMFGFVVLWVVLIVLGTILRGPNWNFFAPFERWDPHKVLPLNNVNLSEMFWIPLGRVPEEMPWYVRELPGAVLIFAYLVIVPMVLARTVFRKFYLKMGMIRYMTLMILLLFMAALPIKMVLRWTLNLKYIVYIPEFFFNI
jgi:hypothetical protein